MKAWLTSWSILIARQISKAHGLGYLYPPEDSPKGWEDNHDAPKWIYQLWECLLRIALKMERNNPNWIKRPQMMRMTVTTFNVLKRLHTWEAFRPYNFFMLPIVAKGGCPAGVDPKRFTLVAPFESDQGKWLDLACINIAAPNNHTVYKVSTSFASPEYGKRAVLEVLEDLLYHYHQHPESKSLGPDGEPCKADTRGLLGRAHIVAGKHRRIGKESDRRWEEGDDLQSLAYVPPEYEMPGTRREDPSLVRPRERLIRMIKKIGIRRLVGFGLGRRILEKICQRKLVSADTLDEYERKIREYKMKV